MSRIDVARERKKARESLMPVPFLCVLPPVPLFSVPQSIHLSVLPRVTIPIRHTCLNFSPTKGPFWVICMWRSSSPCSSSWCLPVSAHSAGCRLSGLLWHAEIVKYPCEERYFTRHLLGEYADIFGEAEAAEFSSMLRHWRYGAAREAKNGGAGYEEDSRTGILPPPLLPPSGDVCPLAGSPAADFWS